MANSNGTNVGSSWDLGPILGNASFEILKSKSAT